MSDRERFAKQIHEEINSAHAALGNFILEFSHAESVLYLILIGMTGVTDPVARAIFSGVRAKGMTEYINTIIANTQDPDPAKRSSEIRLLQGAMGQLNAINTARDQIVHHGMNVFTADGMLVTNQMRVSRYSNTQSYKVNAKELADMCADLNSITSVLLSYALKLSNPSLNPEFPASLPAWRYKARQPKNPPRKNPSDSQKRPRQRKSSPE